MAPRGDRDARRQAGHCAVASARAPPAKQHAGASGEQLHAHSSHGGVRVPRGSGISSVGLGAMIARTFASCRSSSTTRRADAFRVRARRGSVDLANRTYGATGAHAVAQTYDYRVFRSTFNGTARQVHGLGAGDVRRSQAPEQELRQGRSAAKRRPPVATRRAARPVPNRAPNSAKTRKVADDCFHPLNDLRVDDPFVALCAGGL